jgi:hypothetical protein
VVEIQTDSVQVEQALVVMALVETVLVETVPVAVVLVLVAMVPCLQSMGLWMFPWPIPSLLVILALSMIAVHGFLIRREI